MHFNATATYPAPTHKVAELFTNPDFVDAKIVASKATGGKKTITGDATGAFTVETTRTMPKDLAPAQFQSFLPGGITLILTESWAQPGADGNRDGTIELKIAGLPASATGTCTLRGAGVGESVLTYDGDVKVSIPIMGAKIEKIAVGALEDVMRLERDVAATWLAQE